MRLNLKLNSIWSAFLLMIVVSTAAQAQWNWPEDKKTAEEKVVLYTDLKKQGNLQGATEPLQWLLDNAPDLNPSIYINGSDIYEGLAAKETDDAKKQEYIDKAMGMYDKRIEYFGDEGEVLNRKASAAIKLLYKDRSQYDKLYELFSKALEVSGDKFAYYNIVPFMSVIKTQYDQGKLEDEDVLNTYDKLNEIIGNNEASGSQFASKYKEQAEKMDAIFMSTINVDCDFIEQRLVPKITENPEDVETAKKIIALSLSAQCTDRDYFTDAAMTTFEKEPNAGLAKTIGERMARADRLEDAMTFLSKAAELSETDEQKGEIYLSMASIEQKNGNKAKARDYAVQAGKASEAVAEKAYTLVGNLYSSSYEQCKGGDDMVKDRAIFIAAYNMYKLAGNQKGMNSMKEQFPSKEEVFTYGKKVGDSVQVGCWVGESVTIQTRD